MKLPALALLLGLLGPSAALADDGRYFLFTGDGVAPGKGRLGLGIDAVVAVAGSSGGGLPVVGVRYARGLADIIDLRLSLDTLVAYNAFDLGVGIALIKGGAFGLGARAGVTGIVIVSDSSGGVFAATPGLVATLRGSAVAFSFGADVPMYLNGFVVTPSQSSAGSGFVPSVRPMVALELGGSGPGAKFYIHGNATIFFTSGETAILGHGGVGVHF